MLQAVLLCAAFKKVLFAVRDIRKIVHAAKYNVATVLC